MGDAFIVKKMGNAFIVKKRKKKRKKKERESENPPNECCWISNLLNRYTCGKPKCWLLVHFTCIQYDTCTNEPIIQFV